MPLNVIIGPAQSGKKSLLIERFKAVLDRDPILLVPNQPDEIYIKKELFKTVGAIVGSSILSYGKFVNYLAKKIGMDQTLIDSVQQQFIIHRVINETPLSALKESSKYQGFEKAILLFFNELKEGLNTPEAIRTAFSNWKQTFRDQNYLDDIANLYQGYFDKLNSAGLIDSQLQTWDIIASLENGELQEMQPVLLYGFDDFTTGQRRIIELLSTVADITMTLTFEDNDAFFGRNNDVDRLIETASEVTWTTGDGTDNRNGNLPNPSAAKTPKMYFLEAAGTRGEVELIGAKVLELLRSGAYKPHDIAIILRNPNEYTGAIRKVFKDFGIPYSRSEPISFSGSSFGRVLLAALRFCFISQNISDLVMYLRILYPDKQSLIDIFERDFIRSRATDPQEMLNHWFEISKDEACPIGDLLNASEFSEVVQVLVSLGNDLIDAIFSNSAALQYADDEKETLAALNLLLSTLDSLKQLIAIDKTYAPEPADIYSFLANSDMQTEREAEAGTVHVLRVHRSRGRLYKAVFVLGLNEGSFPLTTSENQFFTREENEQLSTLELELTLRAANIFEERYLFYVATTRAINELFLSYQTTTSDGDSTITSSFVTDLQQTMTKPELTALTTNRPLSQVIFDGQAVPIPTQKEALRYAASIYRQQPKQSQSIAIELGETAVFEDALAKAASPGYSFDSEKVKKTISSRTTFSITELELFAKCPFKWFIERVLSPQSIEMELDALLKGSILHYVLEKFYRMLPERFDERRPVKDKLPEMETFIGDLFEDAFERLSPDKVSIDAEFSRHEMKENLKRFIRAEARRRSDFTPHYFEASFGMNKKANTEEYKDECLSLADDINMRGKIDRVDIDKNGNAIVLDYKSSKTFSAKDMASGKSLQAPIYMEAIRRLWGLEPVGGGYLSISKSVADGAYNADIAERTGLPRKAALSADEFNELLSNSLAAAREIASQIKEATFIPKEDYFTCGYCKASHICGKKDV